MRINFIDSQEGLPKLFQSLFMNTKKHELISSIDCLFKEKFDSV